jgi:hypothetical protein
MKILDKIKLCQPKSLYSIKEVNSSVWLYEGITKEEFGEFLHFCYGSEDIYQEWLDQVDNVSAFVGCTIRVMDKEYFFKKIRT